MQKNKITIQVKQPGKAKPVNKNITDVLEFSVIGQIDVEAATEILSGLGFLQFS